MLHTENAVGTEATTIYIPTWYVFTCSWEKKNKKNEAVGLKTHCWRLDKNRLLHRKSRVGRRFLQGVKPRCPTTETRSELQGLS